MQYAESTEHALTVEVAATLLADRAIGTVLRPSVVVCLSGSKGPPMTSRDPRINEAVRRLS